MEVSFLQYFVLHGHFFIFFERAIPNVMTFGSFLGKVPSIIYIFASLLIASTILELLIGVFFFYFSEVDDVISPRLLHRALFWGDKQDMT